METTDSLPWWKRLLAAWRGSNLVADDWADMGTAFGLEATLDAGGEVATSAGHGRGPSESRNAPALNL
jgi:hypothetical protein